MRLTLYRLSQGSMLFLSFQKNTDGLDVSDIEGSARNSPVGPTHTEDLMDIPVEIELRLKKTKTQKRKFVPSIKNNAKRKKAKQ
ncbi:hypothetical protein INT48_001891 [Thamnidium elegans]|uniref:Uncharacterized protein n=1 Tax=Thamnidium elegans TaxID=101142 RepID=A0A8H7SG62_9FUNG|nr:hypothetical protein INT48_001891 [Thamnidium elegans]